jgi:hypothetical protein
MPRKKIPTVEGLPQTATIVVRPTTAEIELRANPEIEAMIGRLVEERLRKIMSDEDAVSESFQPKELSYEFRREHELFERHKWILYFEKWGCQRCERKKINHASKGYCSGCYARLHSRLARIKSDYEKTNPERKIEQDIDRLTSRFRSARALVGKREK